MSDEVMTQEQLSVPYNPNLLVTYKAIPDTYAAPESPTFITEKVTDIEWSLHHGRLKAEVVKENNANLIWLEEQIPEWYDPNYSKEEVLRELAEHFKINPVKEIIEKLKVFFFLSSCLFSCSALCRKNSLGPCAKRLRNTGCRMRNRKLVPSPPSFC